MSDYQLFSGDCLDILPTIPDASVDAIISDPPYPMIKRDYGMMTEAAWMEMMQEVVRQSRRILKPTGSAVFILQPNSEKVGKMRLWLWEFMVWCGKEWNIVQDAYWWNVASLPEAHAIQGGLMRPSVKACVWLGNANCYRNQNGVLWSESDANAAKRLSARAERKEKPSGHGVNELRASSASVLRGGVTPFNLFPTGNNGSLCTGALTGHGAGTPLKLANWWTRYICPPGGTVCDPFTGSGTMGIAALNNGCKFIGSEKMNKHYETACKRLEEAQDKRQPALLEAA